jgi:hypothetical protein
MIHECSEALGWASTKTKFEHNGVQSQQAVDNMPCVQHQASQLCVCSFPDMPFKLKIPSNIKDLFCSGGKQKKVQLCGTEGAQTDVGQR